MNLVVWLTAALMTLAPAWADDGLLRGDWRMACEGTNCAISSKSDEDDIVFLARRGRPLSTFAFGLRLASVSPDPDVPLVLRVDSGPKLSFHPGRDFGFFGPRDDLFLTETGHAERIFTAMTTGRHLQVFMAEGGAIVERRFSLDGFTQALVHVAEAQGRDHDDTQLGPPDMARRGDGARPPVENGIGLRGLPASIVDRHMRESRCEELDSGRVGEIEPVSRRLSATASVYALPCTASSDNVTWRLYLAETGEIGGITSLHFARHDARDGWTGTDLLWNVSLSEDGTLTSLRRGRGETDCGSFARWTWHERRFILQEVRQRSACNGNASSESWPVVYHREN